MKPAISSGSSRSHSRRSGPAADRDAPAAARAGSTGDSTLRSTKAPAAITGAVTQNVPRQPTSEASIWDST